MAKQRISYVAPEAVTDPRMRAEIERSVRVGTPRAESQAVRAHVPAVFWSFVNAWNDVFVNGVVDHDLKELCRVYVAQSVKCEYCASQRSEKSKDLGTVEEDYRELLNFEKTERFDPRTKAALALTEAITWDLEADDALWKRLHDNFTEPEIVELGFFVGLTMGQQRFNRTLNLDQHLGTTGFEATAANS